MAWLKLGGGLIQIALVECLTAFGDVHVDILIAIVRGGKLASLL